MFFIPGLTIISIPDAPAICGSGLTSTIAEKSHRLPTEDPLRLIYYEACIDEQDGFRREKYLKTTYGKRYIKTRCRNYFTG